MWAKKNLGEASDGMVVVVVVVGGGSGEELLQYSLTTAATALHSSTECAVLSCVPYAPRSTVHRNFDKKTPHGIATIVFSPAWREYVLNSIVSASNGGVRGLTYLVGVLGGDLVLRVRHVRALHLDSGHVVERGGVV